MLSQILSAKLYENVCSLCSQKTELLVRAIEISLCMLLYKQANIIRSETDNFSRKEDVFYGYMYMNTEITESIYSAYLEIMETSNVFIN